MEGEVESLVQIDCLRLGSSKVCLPRGNILGTIREITDDCSGDVMTDLSVTRLNKGERCLATAVDCVMATDTGNPSNPVCVLFMRLSSLNASFF